MFDFDEVYSLAINFIFDNIYSGYVIINGEKINIRMKHLNKLTHTYQVGVLTDIDRIKILGTIIYLYECIVFKKIDEEKFKKYQTI